MPERHGPAHIQAPARLKNEVRTGREGREGPPARRSPLDTSGKEPHELVDNLDRAANKDQKSRGHSTKPELRRRVCLQRVRVPDLMEQRAAIV